MKFVRIILFLILLLIVSSACNSPVATEQQSPSLPTPEVPAITEIDAAIQRWESSNRTRYVSEVIERTQNQESLIRLVVADGVIRTAQRLTKTADGNWGEPAYLPKEEAQAYTVDEILKRSDNLMYSAKNNGKNTIKYEVSGIKEWPSVTVA